MKNKSVVKYLLLVLLSLVVAASLFLPIPYFVERPGSTIDLKELVTVNGEKDEQSGSFSLTSVAIRQATVWTAAIAKLDPFQDVISEEEMFGGATDEEYERIQRYYMDSSQNSAIEQALKSAGRPYTFEYKGVYVMSVSPTSNFYGEITVGDTVTKVDGRSFDNNQEFMDYVQSKDIGDEVEVTYVQDDQEKQTKGELIELPTNQKAGIGITLVDHTEIHSEDTIEFDVKNIGGPSAGLMFTLEIYEQLIDSDLRQGKHIAGTGTINSDGTIGRIGGIDKKIASANKEGIEIFFAPDDEITEEQRARDPELKSNFEEAKLALEKLNSSMEIVPVKTLQDALDYLENM